MEYYKQLIAAQNIRIAELEKKVKQLEEELVDKKINITKEYLEKTKTGE